MIVSDGVEKTLVIVVAVGAGVGVLVITMAENERVGSIGGLGFAV